MLFFIWFTAMLKKCSSMADIRKAAEREDLEVDLREEWAQSVQPMIDLLRDRFERLKLKEEPVGIMILILLSFYTVLKILVSNIFK